MDRGGFFACQKQFSVPTEGFGTMAKDDDITAFSRRNLLKTGAGLAAAVAGEGLFAGAALAASGPPEVKGAKLGFIALTDAAPLIVAKELGLFAKYGMPDVTLAKQASWGATRDNLVLGGEAGGIDGAHLLTPMAYFLTLGVSARATAMAILARLNVNGQAISVDKAYLAAKADIHAEKMKGVIGQKKASGKKITMAMTFPGGTHDLWIRYWLAAGGIDPDKDVDLITIPPPQMVANMKADTMDAFCVGEPWNAQLVDQSWAIRRFPPGKCG
jgi:nitrate/nitrite transport system substrate-binding protein